MFLKFIKFGTIGFTGMLIDFSITYLLKEKLKLNKYFANSAGFIIAASSNYFLNRIWTFHSHNSRVLLEYSGFLIISVFGLLINNGFLYLIEKNFSMSKSAKKHLNLTIAGKYDFYFAKLCAIVITTIWNFFANYFITFNL